MNIKNLSSIIISPPADLLTFGGGDFHKVGQEFFHYFVKNAGLLPSDRILEIGSGNGRMAAPLTSFLQSGSYEGFDIVERAVRWCRESITPRSPQFHFHWFNIYNGFYNPAGTIRARTFSFPYPEASFDFIFLTSVFTHMLPEDTEHYLHEISRVLHPDGRMFASFFLDNPAAGQYHKNGRSTMQFSYQHDTCTSTDPTAPEKTICYPETLIRTLLTETGLSVKEPFLYGSWNGRPNFLSFQDIIIASKQKPHSSSPL